MRYPFFVLLALIGAIIIVNIYVVPTFANMFKNIGHQLPLPTRMLLASSNAFIHHWGKMLVVTLAIVFGIGHYLRTPNGELAFHRILLHVPIFGSMIRGTTLLKFSQTFGMTLDSGIPLIEGIELTAQATPNVYARLKILSMRESIERGNSVTQAATKTGLFNSLELQMLSVSEETGELSNMLGQISDHYKAEVEYDLKQLSGMIEPLLIVLLSVVVLFLALAIYLPVWDMATAMKSNS